MTETERAALRALAEKAREADEACRNARVEEVRGTWLAYTKAKRKMDAALTPAVLLSLLDEAPPASPLSDERLAEIRWLANTGVEGSVAATELRELLAEVDRLRALTRRNDA
jgi:hypothetical protein